MQMVIADKRWVKKYPELGTGPVSAEPCISPEYFELERERVFCRTWLCVGRIDEIPDVGDYFVQDITVGQASILIIRGKDDVIRAFYNVCSHRGNKLVWDEKGSCPGVLSCGFHSWTYNTQGQLTWVTDEENFFDLDKSAHGLTPVATDIWQGFIFINLDTNPQESLTEYLGGITQQLGGADFDQLTLAHAYTVNEKANWKIALDAQNELYHLPFQHRNTIPDSCTLKDGRFPRLLDVRLYNHHSVYSSQVPADRIPNPVETLAYRLVSSETEQRLPLIGDFDFYTIFPNFALLLFRGISKDYYLTYSFWPLAVNQTLWDIKLYFPPTTHASQRIGQEYMKCLLRDILHEDAFAHEQIQVGLASRAKKYLLLQDEEIQIRHFHKVLEGYVGA